LLILSCLPSFYDLQGYADQFLSCVLFLYDAGSASSTFAEAAYAGASCRSNTSASIGSHPLWLELP